MLSVIFLRKGNNKKKMLVFKGVLLIRLSIRYQFKSIQCKMKTVRLVIGDMFAKDSEFF